MISGMRVRRRSSAGGKAGYKFYRLFITANTSGQLQTAVRELNLFGPQTPTGIPTGGVPSASSGTFPDRAFDGDTSTRWASAFGPSYPFPQWVQYEFPTPVKLTMYRLLGGTTNNADIGPRDWEFQASNDGTNWDTLDSQTDQTWSTDPSSIKDYPL